MQRETRRRKYFVCMGKIGICDEHSEVHVGNTAAFWVLTDPSRPCCVAGPVGAHVDASEGGQECQHPGNRHRGRGQHPPAIAKDRHHPGECEVRPPRLHPALPFCPLEVSSSLWFRFSLEQWGRNHTLHLQGEELGFLSIQSSINFNYAINL